MKNKKVLITIMTSVIISLICIFVGIMLNITEDKKVNIAQANYIEHPEQVNEEEIIENNKNEDTVNERNVEEKRLQTINNQMIQTVSSRSEVERININPMYVNTEENKQSEEYEEIKTYIKLDDVKISFNMDVSKPTGLSQDDFVELVKNMKYDRTGILEKNAAWIWQCCQKYSVNEIFVLGVCGIESGWCSAKQHQVTHNYSSLMSGGKLIPYATDEQGFEAMIKLLGQKYLSPRGSLYHGKTITGVGTSYCNTTTWPGKVYKCMTQVFE
ncbi:MAG: hypothetical protein E7313_06950 [Clostridiales bacterium]|nr:hypothetical protein [Clostridiales bacterium]